MRDKPTAAMLYIRRALEVRERVIVHREYLADLLALCSRGEARTEMVGDTIYALRPEIGC